MTRYPLLYVWAVIQMILGGIIWALAAFGVFAAATAGPNFQVDLGNVLSEFILAAKIAGVANILLFGFLGGLASMAAGQFILMLMDMADDTRIMRIHKDQEMLSDMKRSGKL